MNAIFDVNKILDFKPKTGYLSPRHRQSVNLLAADNAAVLARKYSKFQRHSLVYTTAMEALKGIGKALTSQELQISDYQPRPYYANAAQQFLMDIARPGNPLGTFISLEDKWVETRLDANLPNAAPLSVYLKYGNNVALSKGEAILKKYFSNFDIPRIFKPADAETVRGALGKFNLGAPIESTLTVEALSSIVADFTPPNKYDNDKDKARFRLPKGWKDSVFSKTVAIQLRLELDRVELIDNDTLIRINPTSTGELLNGSFRAQIPVSVQLIFRWPWEFALYATCATSKKDFVPFLFYQYVNWHRIAYAGKRTRGGGLAITPPTRVNHLENIIEANNAEKKAGRVVRPRMNEDGFVVLGTGQANLLGNVIWVDKNANRVAEYMQQIRSSYDAQNKKIDLTQLKIKGTGLFYDPYHEKWCYIREAGSDKSSSDVSGLQTIDLTGSVALDPVTIAIKLNTKVRDEPAVFKDFMVIVKKFLRGSYPGIQKTHDYLSKDQLTTYGFDSYDASRGFDLYGAIEDEVMQSPDVSYCWGSFGGRLMTIRNSDGEDIVEGTPLAERFLRVRRLRAFTNAIRDISQDLLNGFDKLDMAYSARVERWRYLLVVITKYAKGDDAFQKELIAATAKNTAKKFTVDQMLDVSKLNFANLPGLTEILPHQSETLQDLKDEPTFGFIESFVGGGKCQDYNELVPTNLGMMKIGELYDNAGPDIINGFKKANIKVHFDGKTYTADKVYSTKDKMVVTKTSHGDKFKTLKEHKFWVLQDDIIDFKQVHDLKEGDWLPKKIGLNIYPKTSPKEINPATARLLGFLTSEGYMASNYVSFTNSCEECLNSFKTDWYSVFNRSDLREGTKEGSNVISLYSNKQESDYLYGLGLIQNTSKFQEVPLTIRQSTKEIQVEYLKALFEGDGTVYLKKASKKSTSRIPVVEYDSISFQLIKQVKQILENMGVYSTIRYKVKYATNTKKQSKVKAFNLHLTKKGILEFYKTIGFISSHKKEMLKKCVSLVNNGDVFGHENKYPLGSQVREVLNVVEREIVKEKVSTDSYKNRTYTWTNLVRDTFYKSDIMPPSKPTTVKNAILGKNGVVTSLALDYLEMLIENMPEAAKDRFLRNERAKKYLKVIRKSREFVWTKVVQKIYRTTKTKAYDLVVPGPHAYVSNGFISHNTAMGLVDALDLIQTKKVRRPLFMVPGHLVRNWANEIRKFSKGEVNVFILTIQTVRRLQLTYKGISDPAAKPSYVFLKQILEALPPNTVVITNYRFLIIDTEEIVYGNSIIERFYSAEFLREMGFDGVFCDESHKLKAITAAQSRAAAVVTTSAKYTRLLTGTTVNNTLVDLVGQCVVGSSLIPTKEKGIVSIKSLGNKEPLKELSLTVGSRYGNSKTSHWMRKEKSPTIRVETEDGYKVTGKSEHKMLTLNEEGLGWKRLNRIDNNSYICVSTKPCVRKTNLELDLSDRQLPIVNGRKDLIIPKYMTPKLAYILGGLISEGCLSTKGRICFTNSSLVLINHWNCCFKEVFGVEPTVTKSKNKLIKIKGRKYKAKSAYMSTIKSVELRSVMVLLGVSEKKSAGKTVPWSILQADEQSQLSYIAAYVDGDGSIYENTTHIRSSSKKLVQLTQILLQAHGIASNIVKKVDNYDLKIGYPFNIDLNRKMLPYLVLRKKEAIATHNYLNDNFTNYGIPSNFLIKFLQDRMLERNNQKAVFISDDNKHVKTGTGWFRSAGKERKIGSLLRYDKYLNGTYNELLANVKNISKKFYNSLISMFEERYVYCKVRTIKTCKSAVTYDLTIKGEPAYTVNGMIGHNSALGAPAALGNEKNFKTKYSVSYSGEDGEDFEGDFRPDAASLIIKDMRPYSKRMIHTRERIAWMLPEAVEDFHQVVMTKAQKQFYDALVAEKFDELQEKNPKLFARMLDANEKDSDKLSAGLATHFQAVEQFLCAPDSVEEFTKLEGITEEDLVSPKVKKVVEILDGHFKGVLNNEGAFDTEPEPFKVIIFGSRRVTSAHVFKHLPDRYKSQAVWYNVDNKQSLEIFEKSDKVRILVADGASITEGLQLTMASRMIRMETVWAPGDLIQAFARVYRPAFTGPGALRKKVSLDWVVCGGSLDIAKCVVGSSLIATKERGIVRIDSLGKGKESDLSITVGSRYKPSKTEGWIYNGKRPTVEVESEDGFSVQGMLTHRMLVLNEHGKVTYKNLKNLSYNDYMIVPRDSVTRTKPLKLEFTNVKGVYNSKAVSLPSYMNTDLAFLLGCLDSDGCVCNDRRGNPNVIMFTNNNLNLLEAYINKFKKVFGLVLEARKTSDQYADVNVPGWPTYYANAAMYEVRCQNIELGSFLTNLGVKHGSYAEYGAKPARFKRIPWSIMQADKESQLAYLAAYLECDGCVSEHHIRWYSFSPDMLSDMRVLMQSHGYFAKWADNKHKAIKLDYPFHIDAMQAMDKYLVRKRLKGNNARKKVHCKWGVPFEPIKNFIKSRLVSRKSMKFAEFKTDDNKIITTNNAWYTYKADGPYLKYDVYLNGGYNEFLTNLKKVSGSYYKTLVELINQGYSYTRVMIKKQGPKLPVYDLSMQLGVEPSYVVNGLVGHNCGRIISKIVEKAKFDRQEDESFVYNNFVPSENFKSLKIGDARMMDIIPQSKRQMPVAEMLESLQLIKMNKRTLMDLQEITQLEKYFATYALINDYERQTLDKAKAEGWQQRIVIPDSNRSQIEGSVKLGFQSRVPGVDPSVYDPDDKFGYKPISIIESDIALQAALMESSDADDDERENYVEINPVEGGELVNTEFGIGHITKILQNEVWVEIPGLGPVRVPKACTWIITNPVAVQAIEATLRRAPIVYNPPGIKGTVAAPAADINFNLPKSDGTAPKRTLTRKPVDVVEEKPVVENRDIKLQPAKTVPKKYDKFDTSEDEENSIEIGAEIIDGRIALTCFASDQDSDVLIHEFDFQPINKYLAVEIKTAKALDGFMEMLRDKFSVTQEIADNIEAYGDLIKRGTLEQANPTQFAQFQRFFAIEQKKFIKEGYAKPFPIVWGDSFFVGFDYEKTRSIRDIMRAIRKAAIPGVKLVGVQEDVHLKFYENAEDAVQDLEDISEQLTVENMQECVDFLNKIQKKRVIRRKEKAEPQIKPKLVTPKAHVITRKAPEPQPVKRTLTRKR